MVRRGGTWSGAYSRSRVRHYQKARAEEPNSDKGVKDRSALQVPAKTANLAYAAANPKAAEDGA